MSKIPTTKSRCFFLGGEGAGGNPPETLTRSIHWAAPLPVAALAVPQLAAQMNSCLFDGTPPTRVFCSWCPFTTTNKQVMTMASKAYPERTRMASLFGEIQRADQHHVRKKTKNGRRHVWPSSNDSSSSRGRPWQEREANPQNKQNKLGDPRFVNQRNKFCCCPPKKTYLSWIHL